MKKIAFFLLMMIPILSVFAQEETLLSGDIESGGFGGPALKVTQINGEGAVLVGGRGGWIINHSFVLGGGGYGLVNDISAKVPDTSRGLTLLEMGYGGLDLEYIASSDNLIHLSIGLLIGGGGVGYKDEHLVGENRNMDQFFIVEPSAHVNLNVTEFFRIAAGVSYRYVNGVNSAVTSDADLSGPSAVLTLKFGTF